MPLSKKGMRRPVMFVWHIAYLIFCEFSLYYFAMWLGAEEYHNIILIADLFPKSGLDAIPDHFRCTTMTRS